MSKHVDLLAAFVMKDNSISEVRVFYSDASWIQVLENIVYRWEYDRGVGVKISKMEYVKRVIENHRYAKSLWTEIDVV